LVNIERRNIDPKESLRIQACYSDTDSIIFPYSALYSAQLMTKIGDDDGLLGDDLVGKWRKKDPVTGKKNKDIAFEDGRKCLHPFCLQQKKVHKNIYCIHEIAVCKIIEFYSPSPKVYALKYIDPNGYLHDDTLKFKGIAQTNIKITKPGVKAQPGDLFNDSLSFKHFKERESLVVSREGVTPIGMYPNSKEQALGLMAHDIKANIMGRTIFGNEWVKRTPFNDVFPEFKNQEQFKYNTLPLGYEKVNK
jgi:hypothetical protein